MTNYQLLNLELVCVTYKIELMIPKNFNVISLNNFKQVLLTQDLQCIIYSNYQA